jgi:hypothetical protein
MIRRLINALLAADRIAEARRVYDQQNAALDAKEARDEAEIAALEALLTLDLAEPRNTR